MGLARAIALGATLRIGWDILPRVLMEHDRDNVPKAQKTSRSCGSAPCWPTTTMSCASSGFRRVRDCNEPRRWSCSASAASDQQQVSLLIRMSSRGTNTKTKNCRGCAFEPCWSTGSGDAPEANGCGYEAHARGVFRAQTSSDGPEAETRRGVSGVKAPVLLGRPDWPDLSVCISHL